MPDSRSILKKYYNALRVEDPLDYGSENDRGKYVAGLHGEKDVVKVLCDTIDFQDGQGVFLFSGHRGSGKSTELKRLKYLLETKVLARVDYLDMSRWINYNRPIELGGFIVSLVAAWIDQLGVQSNQTTLTEKFRNLLTNTKINIDHLRIEGGVANFKATLQLSLMNNSQFLTEIDTAIKTNRDSFVNQAKNLISDIVAEICPNREKCVLLVDSLEKISGIGDTAEQVLRSVFSLFSQNSDALQLPRVHVVYSIAPYVLEQNRNLPVILGGATSVQLPSVHVFQRDSNDPDHNGINRVEQVVTSRCPDWINFITQSDLRQLITDSGGDLRDLMRALQNYFVSLAGSARQNSAEHLEFARNQIRPTLVIPIEHMKWMELINRTHRAEVNSEVDSLLLEKYLNTKHILAYLNGETWYGINPLIINQIEEQVRRHSSANIAS